MIKKKLEKTLEGEKFDTPPIWIMRQAGRYLPEYREIRKQAKNFLEFCYNIELATEVTLQPIRRYDFDAAIIFSDILVILDALNYKVEFIEKEGPIITNKDTIIEFDQNIFSQKLENVYKIANNLRNKLDKNKNLIGFCGAFWTLLTYIFDRKSKDYANTKKFILTQNEKYSKLKDILIKAISIHAINQIKNGCDIIQIFDSWAGSVPHYLFDELIIEPTRIIVNNIRKEFPNIKIICFPKNIVGKYRKFVEIIKPDGISIDYLSSFKYITKELEGINITLQGNLDPVLLLSENRELIKREIDRILKDTEKFPLIFNLGHGILPETNPDIVKFMVEYLREGI